MKVERPTTKSLVTHFILWIYRQIVCRLHLSLSIQYMIFFLLLLWLHIPCRRLTLDARTCVVVVSNSTKRKISCLIEYHSRAYEANVHLTPSTHVLPPPFKYYLLHWMHFKIIVYISWSCSIKLNIFTICSSSCACTIFNVALFSNFTLLWICSTIDHFRSIRTLACFIRFDNVYWFLLGCSLVSICYL